MKGRLVRLDATAIDLLEPLRRAAVAEGYGHLERLSHELGGRAAEGWTVLGVVQGDSLVAVGAMTPDPHDPAPDLMRVRRFYVAPAQRRANLGAGLAAALIGGAPQGVDRLSLRAPDARAARFWEAQGFLPDAGPGRTHLRRRPWDVRTRVSGSPD